MVLSLSRGFGMTSAAPAQLDLLPPAAAEPPAARTVLIARAAPDLAYEIRSGHHCRVCRHPLAWPDPAGVMFADRTAECHSCHEAYEVRNNPGRGGNDERT